MLPYESDYNRLSSGDTKVNHKMTRDWEATFRTWGKAPGATEQAKCENAERAILKAIRASGKLSSHDVRVFAQGSYRNRTNVPAESDVDICVCCSDVFFTDFDFTLGLTRGAVGVIDSSYAYSTYKGEVEEALKDYFGSTGVTRGVKAFDIHENTYRVDADVIACFEHRRYLMDVNGLWKYETGTEFKPDDDQRQIVNWPDQQYDNGVAKNSATSQRFKGVVRAIKNLRNEMAEAGINEAKPISSFLIESLVYNVPNDLLSGEAYTRNIQDTLLRIYVATDRDESCQEWREVSERKYLFRTIQPWTRTQVRAFSQACWNYVGF